MKTMRKFFLRFVLSISGLIIIYSCDSGMLDVDPVDKAADNLVWSNSTMADGFINEIYASLPSQYYGYVDRMENFSDNTIPGQSWVSSERYSSGGQQTPSSWFYESGYNSCPNEWAGTYSRIRQCNVAIAKLQEYASNFSVEYIQLRTAEARFLRSFFYMYLFMSYGGVPLITEPLDIATMGDKIFKPRASSVETAQFIIDECEAVADDLSPNYENYEGRATTGAALALKSWIELYIKKYADAKATIEALMKLNKYELVSDLKWWMPQYNCSKEEIFARQHRAGVGSHNADWFFGPGGIGGVGGWVYFLATQSMVDTYGMANGLPINDPDSGYNNQDPYNNRDPRFYANIVYDGAFFAGVQFNYVGDMAPGQGNNRTGYQIRKLIDETTMIPGSSTAGKCAYNYYFFRYGWVLLNYAEACIETNDYEHAIEAINKIRIRAAIPPLEDTYHKNVFMKEELMAIYKKERRVETFAEDWRYWDLIRWREAHIELNKPVKGVTIEYADGYKKYSYERICLNRTFNEHNYLFPIRYTVIDQNPVIAAQNGGIDNWVNGQNSGY